MEIAYIGTDLQESQRNRPRTIFLLSIVSNNTFVLVAMLLFATLYEHCGPVKMSLGRTDSVRLVSFASYLLM